MSDLRPPSPGRKVKKLIPRGWSKVKGVDHATIGQVNQLVFKIFYLKSDSSLFVPKNEFDKEETYLILSGTCAVQLGDEVRRYTQGDFIHVPSNIVHGVTTAKKEEVVVGYVHSKTKARAFGQRTQKTLGAIYDPPKAPRLPSRTTSRSKI